MSFLIMTFKIPSRYYIKGYHNIDLIAGIYSLITFIFGWWGIPWGPLYTIQVIGKNIAGGSSLEVKSFLPSKDTTRLFKD
jgi:hypothetical protein